MLNSGEKFGNRISKAKNDRIIVSQKKAFLRADVLVHSNNKKP